MQESALHTLEPGSTLCQEGLYSLESKSFSDASSRPVRVIQYTLLAAAGEARLAVLGLGRLEDVIRCTAWHGQGR